MRIAGTSRLPYVYLLTRAAGGGREASPVRYVKKAGQGTDVRSPGDGQPDGGGGGMTLLAGPVSRPAPDAAGVIAVAWDQTTSQVPSRSR
jgi:hypothetical protein